MTDLHGSGFAIADLELSHEQCSYLATALPSVAEQRGGARGLLAHPTILQLIRHKQLGQFLWALTGRELVAVAARLIDSATVDDEALHWHQERSVTVRERMEVAGFGPWSSRVGIWHVEPPASVLDQMVIVRLHLDECAPGREPLQLFPGTHREGKLTAEAIQHIVDTQVPLTPEITRGMLVAMRPLLVHATQASLAHYRVLQIEFGPLEAISPLQWHSTVTLHHAA